MRIKIHSLIYLLLLSVVITTWLSACYDKNDGGEIAKTYCGSCHLMPDPKLLDKKTWRDGVLPKMAIQLGLRPLEDLQKDLGANEIQLIRASGVIPSQPVLPEAEFQKIVQFYIENAPDSLPQNTQKIAYQDLSLFEPKAIPTTSKGCFTLLKYDQKIGKLFVADRQKGFYMLGNNFKEEAKTTLESTASDVLPQPDGSLLLSLMGQMDPTNQASGTLTKLVQKNDGFDAKNIQFGLLRPTCIFQSDLNQDGNLTTIVGNFGYFFGHLSFYDKTGTGHFIRPFPGALKIIVKDFNGDKRPDIMALMAQGNEGVFIFYNKGKNVAGVTEFQEEQVLKFPPVYGSSSMDLVDFDGDGDDDIVYANGDNGDYSRVLKPYHGIRIFLNDGKNHFTEKYFFPMNGATKALARDFDGDGDLDIAAIAFFADFTKKPQKTFVYLENQGNFKFIPHISEKTDAGRWLVMEAADFDHDGDDDILLGSCSGVVKVQPDIKKAWMDANVTLMLLENKRKK